MGERKRERDREKNEAERLRRIPPLEKSSLRQRRRTPGFAVCECVLLVDDGYRLLLVRRYERERDETLERNYPAPMHLLLARVRLCWSARCKERGENQEE